MEVHVIQEMDISVKSTRKRGITLAPTLMILLIDTFQVHMSAKNISLPVYIKKITKIILLGLKY